MTTDDKSSSNISSIVRFKSREKQRDAEKALPPVGGPDFRNMKLATSQLIDPWEDILAGVKMRPALAGSINWECGEQRVSSNFLLTGMLHLTGAKMQGGKGKRLGRRLAKCMRKLGWHGPKAMQIKGGTVTVKGYWRWLSEEESNARDAAEFAP
jgi:hypothetical protein